MNQRRAFLLMVSAAVLWGRRLAVPKVAERHNPSLFALAVYMLGKARVIDSKRLRIAATIGLIEPRAAYLFLR